MTDWIKQMAKWLMTKITEKTFWNAETRNANKDIDRHIDSLPEMVVSISVFGDFLLNELTRLDSNCNAVTRNALNPLMSFYVLFVPKVKVGE